MGHRGFQLKYVSRHWVLVSRNGDGLGGGGLRESTLGRKVNCSTQNLLSPLEMGTMNEEQPQQKVC